MSVISSAVLALSMSADAFAVAVGRGACSGSIRLLSAMKTALMFGLVEGFMPLLGWLLGHVATGIVQRIDHWIAFVILGSIGTKMMVEGFRAEEDPEACKVLEKKRGSLVALFLTAVGTSIDSLAVGVSLAFMNVSIILSALMIGTASFTMATTGLLIGRFIGAKMGKRAEILGGLGLFLVGVKILAEHTGFWG